MSRISVAVFSAHAVGVLNGSRAAEADGNFAGFQDDGNIALVIVEREHAPKTLSVIQDIDILEGDVALCVSLTGFARVGSEILTEDENLFHRKYNIKSRP